MSTAPGAASAIVGSFLADHRGDDLFVATKMGRQVALDPANYTLDAFRGWVDESRARLGVERLDLIQLHTLPTETVDADATYDALDQLVAEGSIAHYGVSVETEGQALSAIGRPNVAAVQIIVNAFRQRPLERVLPAALDAGVAIIARVPLASGLLSGKYTRDTQFAADDHRSYNRHGEKFDAGETFSGVDYEVGVDAAHEFAEYADSQGLTPATAALAWLVQLPGITTVIPGARSVEQARANAAAADVPALTPEFTAAGDRPVRPSDPPGGARPVVSSRGAGRNVRRSSRSVRRSATSSPRTSHRASATASCGSRCRCWPRGSRRTRC